MEFEMVRDAVKKCGLFKGFDEEKLGYLLMHLEIKEFPEGATIYKKGDEAGTDFLLLIGGEACLTADDGRMLEPLGTCQIIGELGVISPRQKRTATVISMKPVKALKWDYAQIKDRVPELESRLKDLACKHASRW